MLPKYSLPPSVDVAYFCMEYALDDAFPLYSGGLGVLAGDTLLESQHSSLTFLFVGLRYAQAYAQRLDEHGRQTEQVLTISPDDLELQPILTSAGDPLTVTVPLADRVVTIRLWMKSYERSTLLLLDTDVSENTDADRHITDQLYAGNKDHRLQQEIILGIGGMRALTALGITPQKYHMNEGHAALLVIEAAHALMAQHHLSLDEAVQAARARLVFTNHTLIPAGNDSFDQELFTNLLARYAQSINLDIHQVLKLGQEPTSSDFSMTITALRGAGSANAVSHYHADRAQSLWPDYPLQPITNGIYLRRWISAEKALVWPLQATGSQPTVESWWEAHRANKQHLLGAVQDITRKQLAPETLIITWARRFVEYKQPKALFWQLAWLENILEQSPVPIHFLFAGKVHPHDHQGKQFIADVEAIAHSREFSRYVSFLPNYNLQLASILTQGSDVWLNTPKVGYEACGTSGMKAALNGVLQCSTNDGWVREVSWRDIGWILDDQKVSESIYETIEHQIIPLYLQRNHNDIPVQWVERMITSSQIIREHYSTTRMLAEYSQKLYGRER